MVSCDKYADLWPIFFNAYFKFWHDQSMPLYLGSNTKVYQDKRVIPIQIGEDKDYTTNLIKMLEKINTEYVIIMLEDVFLSEVVDANVINKYIDAFLEQKGIYLKLVNTYPMANNLNAEYPIGNININSRYRIGMAAALWERNWLVNNLPVGIGAWQLEKDQTNVKHIPESMAFAINKNYNGPIPFKFVHGVIKGKWFRESVNYIIKEGFENILKGRKVQPLYNYFYVKLFKLIMIIFIKINYVWK